MLSLHVSDHHISFAYPSLSSWSEPLSSLVAKNRPYQVSLFRGYRGVGKRDVAAAYVTHLLCQKAGLKQACGKCLSCQIFQRNGVHPDFFDLQRDTRSSIISFDVLRSWLKHLLLRPVLSLYRIGYVDSLADIQPQTLAIFLKAIEEPKSHLIFVLIHHQGTNELPATLKSRCQHLWFPPVSFSSSQQSLFLKHRPWYFNVQNREDFLSLHDPLQEFIEKRSFTEAALFIRDWFKGKDSRRKERMLFFVDACLLVVREYCGNNRRSLSLTQGKMWTVLDELLQFRRLFLQGVPIQPVLALENIFLSLFKTP